MERMTRTTTTIIDERETGVSTQRVWLVECARLERRHSLQVSRTGGWLLAAVLALATVPQAAAISVLKSFPAGPAGENRPMGALTHDGAGNLYGTTTSSGPMQPGTVFRIKTDGSGYTVLHTFANGVSLAAGLVLDGAGTLYGTTQNDGASKMGTIFKLKTDGSGYAVMHSFTADPLDASNPTAGLILDSGGTLYGTTLGYPAIGGMQVRGSTNAVGKGTVFSIKKDGTDFAILHHFAGGTQDGAYPNASVVLDSAGTLYGLTYSGGASGEGTVFRLKTDGTGFGVLHSFAAGAAEGMNPLSSLVLDGAGILYGTTAVGGASGQGAVFSLKTDGTSLAVLHTFTGGPSDGAGPRAAVVLDGANTLYGTTVGGGASNMGTIFRVKADGSNYSVLHAFAGAPSDGSAPMASLILDGTGSIYGTTYIGGTLDEGTVFALPPTGNQPPTFTSASHAVLLAGAPGAFTVTATGHPIPTITSIGALPAGATFKDNGNSTATISGTPAAGSAGVYPLTFTAHNGIGADATQAFTLTVAAFGITTPSALPNGRQGSPYTATLSAIGGIVPYTWSLTFGSLPTNILLSSGSGVLSGTPMASGDSSFTIIVTDSVGSTAQRTFSLHVDEAYPYLVWVPVVSHTSGLHQSEWRSDLGILNPGNARANLLIAFFGKTGIVTQASFVPPGSQSKLTDVVGQLGSSGSGALQVLSDLPLKVTSRTYNQVSASAACSANGTLGQDYPALLAGNGLVATQEAYLPGLVENASYRCNIGLVNVGSSSATVLVELFSGDGTKLTAYPVALAAGQWAQETQPFKSKAGQTAMDRGFARVTVQSGSGVFAFASIIDVITNDPTTITMQQ